MFQKVKLSSGCVFKKDESHDESCNRTENQVDQNGFSIIHKPTRDLIVGIFGGKEYANSQHYNCES